MDLTSRVILKDVSEVPSFNTGSDHCVLQTRICIIPADEKRMLNISKRLGAKGLWR